MKQEINLPSFEGNVLTILEGKALELKHPVKIEIPGDIHSVSNFLKIRKELGTGLQTIDISKAILFVNIKDRIIRLSTDPENAFGTIIQGELEVSDELKQFFINNNKTFAKTDLVKLLKFNKMYFADASKHASMVLAFQKVESTVNIKANESSDERGNKERAYVKEVTTNAPTEFILTIPIFKGFHQSTFRVEICIDVTDGSARFWFESVELHELMIRMIDEIFTEELKCAEGFVIINQ